MTAAIEVKGPRLARESCSAIQPYFSGGRSARETKLLHGMSVKWLACYWNREEHILCYEALPFIRDMRGMTASDFLSVWRLL